MPATTGHMLSSEHWDCWFGHVFLLTKTSPHEITDKDSLGIPKVSAQEASRWATFRIFGRACWPKAIIILRSQGIEAVHSCVWHRDIVQQDVLLRPCQPRWSFQVVKHLAQRVDVVAVRFHFSLLDILPVWS